MMLRASFLLLAMAVLGGCGGSSATTQSTRAISIPFEAVAGMTPINCSNLLQGLGKAGTDVALSDFKLFIHDVRLVTDEGMELPVQLDPIAGWQTDNIALLDFQDYSDSCNTSDASYAKAVNHTLYGQVADNGAVISAIRFVVGVPVSHNHADAPVAPAPLNTPSMFWSWQGGYKHFRADVKPLGGVRRPDQFNNEMPPKPLPDASIWQFHLGDTDCTSDPVGSCTYRNRPHIELNSYREGDSVIRIDYAALVANSTLSEDHGGAPGCMSGTGDPECVAVFDALGLVLGDPGHTAPSAQTVFSLNASR